MDTVRILFLAANPNELIRLALPEEVRLISERLRQSGAGDRIELRVAWAVRAQEIPGLLLQHRPHIVHFSGHGSQAGELLFVGQDGAAAVPVSADTLRRIFEALRDDIRCVVLSACYSATQAAAVAQVVPCVVGMSRAVSDEAALAFSYGFYETLAYGRSIKTAFDLGQAQTELIQASDQREVPQLLTRPGVEPERLVLLSTTAPAPPPLPTSATSATPGTAELGVKPAQGTSSHVLPSRPVSPVASATHGTTDVAANPSTASGARLLICFSSQDAEGKEEVVTQLAPLLQKSALSSWSIDKVPYGAASSAEFAREAARADAALLLLSSNFLADPQIEQQLSTLEEQHRQRGLRIIPLVWRACNWQQLDWLKPLMPAPRDGSPLMSMDKPRRERELVTIVSQIQVHPVSVVATVRPQTGAKAIDPQQRLSGALRPPRLHSAEDPALARRLYGYGEALLDCDRGEQWVNLRELVGNEHHELILLPGPAGQAHRFFLDRIEIALPGDPPRRIVRVDWEAPRELTVPQFRQNRREALAALAQALDLPASSIEDLPKVLHAQLEEHHLVLLHPVVNRCLEEIELSQYYCEWIPELLGNSRTPYRCKLVQPIEWSAEGPKLRSFVKGLLKRESGRPARADQRQATAFMDGVKKQMPAAAKKRDQPQVLRVTQLPELAQLLKKDVVKFLEIKHYGDDRSDSDGARSALADHVLEGDASSEQILQRLCRELPREMWPSGTP